MNSPNDLQQSPSLPVDFESVAKKLQASRKRKEKHVDVSQNIRSGEVVMANKELELKWLMAEGGGIVNDPHQPNHGSSIPTTNKGKVPLQTAHMQEGPANAHVRHELAAIAVMEVIDLTDANPEGAKQQIMIKREVELIDLTLSDEDG
ncbi:hypothetical protein QTG54_009504 [Skeletonema marinoi]|uniref:Uncharacterized protein n=1 Tax=Skeletonema marinoi TaxID=267567 RepID=A0AAD8Y6Y4_9STRA|nr:hypothetical protein QTG54_009504 [Skeletonema marinoi]